jgi:hypothetical protein
MLIFADQRDPPLVVIVVKRRFTRRFFLRRANHSAPAWINASAIPAQKLIFARTVSWGCQEKSSS